MLILSEQLAAFAGGDGDSLPPEIVHDHGLFRMPWPTRANEGTLTSSPFHLDAGRYLILWWPKHTADGSSNNRPHTTTLRRDTATLAEYTFGADTGHWPHGQVVGHLADLPEGDYEITITPSSTASVAYAIVDRIQVIRVEPTT